MRIFGSLFIYLFLLLSCQPGVRLNKSEGSTQKVNAEIQQEDSLSNVLILPYREKLEKDMNEILADNDTLMEKGNPESLLGNFTSDLILSKARKLYAEKSGKEIDLCLLNNGGLRTSLPKGPVSRGKVYELMPFENELVVLTLSGEQIQGLLDYIAKNDGMPVSGIRLGIKNKAVGTVTIGKQGFQSNREYVVVTSDYLAAGGDKMSFFSNPLKTDTLHYKLRDAIIDHLKELKANGTKMTAKLDGRVYYE